MQCNIKNRIEIKSTSLIRLTRELSNKTTKLVDCQAKITSGVYKHQVLTSMVLSQIQIIHHAPKKGCTRAEYFNLLFKEYSEYSKKLIEKCIVYGRLVKEIKWIPGQIKNVHNALCKDTKIQFQMYPIEPERNFAIRYVHDDIRMAITGVENYLAVSVRHTLFVCNTLREILKLISEIRYIDSRLLKTTYKHKVYYSEESLLRKSVRLSKFYQSTEKELSRQIIELSSNVDSLYESIRLSNQAAPTTKMFKAKVAYA
ncbi:hypothetical protein [Teredinibacter sp. KSP-S5-2]|uniref:hypothetical protein n=1 Tax=Teredinibacter sp. KSP-S5-2 TaxID=3034506 RepID=UPI0029352E1C|nr:hypothetical protein [Teredinibacter sp. KSP-S5-2]WNO11416.1 hypothetical protein P5V12_09560 [Teredinibacter sp. KSP-S5-2]